jgi:putative ABC transport system ATP-binding protein
MPEPVGPVAPPVPPGPPTEARDPEFVSVRNVTRTYPKKGDVGPTVALRDVSLRVERGNIIGIQGESGSGKTTLLNLIGGLDAPTEGEIVVAGRSLGGLSSSRLADYRATTVGFVFQDYHLLPDLSAVENVLLAMEAGPSIDRREARLRATQLLEAVGMRKRAEYRPGSLSGGQKQRVAIARALANRPALVLADEPTGNLDPNSRNQVMSYLTGLARKSGVTVVVVTHDPQVAGLCDGVFRFREGRGTNEGITRLVRS